MIKGIPMINSMCVVLILFLIVTGWSQSPKSVSEDPIGMSKHVLWYEHPAQEWEEALPLGNGRIGAMVFGGIDRERINLNEETIYSGKPQPKTVSNVEQLLLKKRQELVFAGKYNEAKNLSLKDIDIPEGFAVKKEEIPGTSRSRHINKPLADLYLHFGSTREIPTDYYRDLDLDRAVATVRYMIGDVTYTREFFCSYPDQVMVVRVTADKPGKVSFNSTMTRRTDVKADMYRYDAELGAKVESITRPPDPKVTVISPTQFSFSGQADPDGVTFVAHFRVVTEGGVSKRIPAGFQVEDADAAVLFITAATDYHHENPDKAASDHMAAVSRKSFDELMKRHVADHQSLFRRVSLDLGTGRASELPTDKRVLSKQLDVKDPRVPAETELDPDLYALFFQYGRYLMIASSRSGTLPPDLQGIWNDSLLPPWFGGFFSDINLQMSYWPAETCNLSECHLPLLDISERHMPPAQKAAELAYGARGMVMHGMTIWGPKTASGGWQDFGGWLAQHFWEHYAFSGDREFLAKRAYPFLKENALFYLDFMVEHPEKGWLVSGPAYSPENTFVGGHIDMGVTMSVAIIRELFGNTIEASEILGVDTDLRKQLRSALQNLPPYQIGRHGQLQEWLTDHRETNPGHRHMSHLYAVSPGYTITPGETPKLAKAAKTSLLRRLNNNGAWTGWSRAWATHLAARLGDGKRAGEQLELQLAKTTYPNLFDSHPRRGGTTRCAQLEGNFGATAAIAEMLLQSHTGELELLPALPPKWRTGHVKGLCARGGFEVDMEWMNGALARVMVHSRLGGPCSLRYGGNTIRIETETGKRYFFDGDLVLDDGEDKQKAPENGDTQRRGSQ